MAAAKFMQLFNAQHLSNTLWAYDQNWRTQASCPRGPLLGSGKSLHAGSLEGTGPMLELAVAPLGMSKFGARMPAESDALGATA